MKFLPLLTFTFLGGLVALETDAATFYTYHVAAESLPCNSANGAGNSNIDLQGTITTDGLGTLSASDIVVWDLTITLSDQTPIHLTQNKGPFSTFGSPQMLATSSELTMTRHISSDRFIFAGSSTAPASWFYGLTPSLEVLFYNTDANIQYYVQRMLTTPSTFTATAVAATEEVPEPASVVLVVIAGFAGLGIMNIRHSRWRWMESVFSQSASSSGTGKEK